MKPRRRKKKQTPKKSKRIEPDLMVRSDPVLPEGVRIDCDLTTRTYRADIQTLDKENRSIECIIATENRVKVIDWGRYEVIEEILLMDGLRMPPSGQVPLLDTHDRSTIRNQHGSTRNLRIENNRLIGRDYFSRSAESEHPWMLTEEGHLTDRSAGYRVHNSIRIDAGQSADFRGQVYKASPNMALRISHDWELRENTLCSIGADEETKVRKQESPADGHNSLNRKGTDMEKFKEWLQKRGLEYDELNEAQREALKKDFDKEQQRAEEAQKKQTDGQRSAPDNQPPAAGDNPAGDSQRNGISTQEAQRIASQAVAAEQKRQTSIRTEAAGLGIEQTEIQRMLDDPSVTIDSARTEFLKIIRQRNGGSNRVSPEFGIVIPDRSVDQRMLADVMLLRVGFENLVTTEEEGQKRAELADRHRDMSMVDICRHAILLEGGTVPGNRDEMIRVALNTSTLPTVLGAVYHKSLLKGYTSPVDTWSKWCTVGNLSDFKVHNRVRLTGEGEMEKIGDGGELKLGSETEEKETNQLETYGKKDRYGRQAIINDDLNLLTKVPQRRGRDGKLLIGKLVYTVLLANGSMVSDSVAIFHANHSNLNTNKAMTSDNIAYGITQFRKQTDKAGKRINVRPVYLLVPVELEFSAKQIVESPLVVYAGTSAANKQVGNKNVLQNALTVLAEVLLSDSSITGYSATTWYITGDPADVDTIEVGFLNGRQVPTVHMTPKVSDMYIEFESYIDVGVGAMDYRGMQKNTV